MDRKERLEIMQNWEYRVKELHKQWDRYEDLFYIDSPFANSVFFMEQEYTKAVEAMLGLYNNELGWWQYENHFGKLGCEVGALGEDVRPMKTLKQYERFLFPK